MVGGSEDSIGNSLWVSRWGNGQTGWRDGANGGGGGEQEAGGEGTVPGLGRLPCQSLWPGLVPLAPGQAPSASLNAQGVAVLAKCLLNQ